MARGILDGHIVLSRKLADRSHYPAVDVLASVSRVMPDIVSKAHYEGSRRLREVMAIYRDLEELLQVGAYKPGTAPEMDRAVRMMPHIYRFLRQGVEEYTPLEDTLARMLELAGQEEPC
jgi:flagellum-specific ATP synthase